MLQPQVNLRFIHCELKEFLSVGEVAARSGVAISALHFVAMPVEYFVLFPSSKLLKIGVSLSKKFIRCLKLSLIKKDPLIKTGRF